MPWVQPPKVNALKSIKLKYKNTTKFSGNSLKTYPTKCFPCYIPEKDGVKRRESEAIGKGRQT